MDEMGQSSGPSTGKLFGIAVFAGLIVALGVGFFMVAGGNRIMTGLAGTTGVVGVTVTSELGIEVDATHNAINFGTLSRGASADTLPPAGGPTTGTVPFQIRNIGNVAADVEICGASLWSSTSKAPTDYQFSVAPADPRVPMDSCTITPCYKSAGTPSTATPIPLTCPVGALAVNVLNWENDRDEAIVHVYIHVPTDEAPGPKSSVVTFSAVAASTYP